MNLPKKNINLLPKSELENTLIGRILLVILTWGRFILIFTELTVVSAFVYRFKLDRDLTALNEAISSKQQVLMSYLPLENDVRFLQQRLAYIKQVQTANLPATTIANELNQLTPKEVTYSELIINPDNLSIKGTSLSNIGLNTFIYNLKSASRYNQINFNSINSKGNKDPSLTFSLNMQINKQ